MDNFNKKKINPIEFIQRYNVHYNKSLVFKNDMKNIRNPVFSGIHHHLSTDST